jgi:hypothetical protein
VDESAEAVASEMPSVRAIWWRGGSSHRWPLTEGSMRPVVVVVRGVLGQDVGEVAWSGDEDAAEAFSSQGPDPALSDRVRPRSLRWRLDDADPGGAESGAKASVNFVSRSRMRKRNCSARSLRSIGRFRACWVTQRPVELAQDAAMWLLPTYSACESVDREQNQAIRKWARNCGIALARAVRVSPPRPTRNRRPDVDPPDLLLPCTYRSRCTKETSMTDDRRYESLNLHYSEATDRTARRRAHHAFNGRDAVSIEVGQQMTEPLSTDRNL